MLTTDEEKRIVQFVTDRVNLGVGLDFDQLKSVIQELLIELKKADKERYIPPTWENCYPFNPQAPDRSKLQPGDQYQPSEDSPGDIRDVDTVTFDQNPFDQLSSGHYPQ